VTVRGRGEAAELAHRVWQHLRTEAEHHPEQFVADERFSVAGWRYLGAITALIRDAVPDIADTDLRRARAHLDAAGMVVNVRGPHRGGRPEWFIRGDWHEHTGGHVRMRGPRAHQPASPGSSQVPPGEAAPPQSEDVAETLRSLIGRVTALQSDNNRLAEENDELRREAQRLHAENRRLTLTANIARQAAELLSQLPD
jgi:hypothetical protein